MLAWLKSHPVHIAAVLTLASTLFFVPGMLVPDVIQLSFNVDFHQTQVNPNGGGGYPPNNSPMSLALSSEMPLTASLRTAHRLASSAILAAAQNGAAPAAGKNDEVGDSPTTTVDTTVFSDSFARWSYLQFSWQIDFSETVVITQDGEPSPQTSSMSIYTAGTTPMTSSCQVDLSQIVRDAIASSGLNSTQVDDIIAQMQQEDPDQWYALTHSPILDECSQWSAAFGIGLTAIGFSILLLVAEVFVIKSQHPIAVLVAPAVAVLACEFHRNSRHEELLIVVS
jgi:hypothetical protein